MASAFRVPGVLGGWVGTENDLRLKAGFFLTIMVVLNRHFLCLACRLRYATGLLVRRLRILLNRIASGCEDFRLDQPLGVCLMVVLCLSPGVWDSVKHLSTSPKPREAKITPQILPAGNGGVGCYRMTDQEWGAAVPPEFLRYRQTFDLRTADRGNGRVRATVSWMTYTNWPYWGVARRGLPPYRRPVFPLSFPKMISNAPCF